MTQCNCHCPSSCTECKKVSKLEFGYRLWQKENELVNQRLSWLGFTQSLLFTILLVSEQFELGIGLGIAGFGFLTSAAVLTGIVAALNAQFRIDDGTEIYQYGGIKKSASSNQRAWSFGFGWVPGLGLPICFVAGWAVIFFHVYSDGQLAIAKDKPKFEVILGDLEIRLNR